MLQNVSPITFSGIVLVIMAENALMEQDRNFYKSVHSKSSHEPLFIYNNFRFNVCLSDDISRFAMLHFLLLY